MKTNLFNHKQKTPMAQKISKEEIEKPDWAVHQSSIISGYNIVIKRLMQ